MSDDCSYFEYAAGNQPEYAVQNGQRIGFILFIKFFLLIFGYGSAAYYASAFFSFLALGLSVYLLASLSEAPLIAFLVAVIVLCEPALLGISSLVLPEILAIACFICGLFFVAKGLERDISPKKGAFFAFASAMSFFYSIWVKETSVFLCLAVLVYLIFQLRNPVGRTFVLYLSISTISILAVESLLYTLVYNDPFYRINIILGGHVRGARELWLPQEKVPDNYSWMTMFSRFILLLWKGNAYTRSPAWGIPYYSTFLIATAAALIWSVFTRNKAAHLLAMAIVIGYVCLSLAPVKLDPIVPLLRTKHRYIIIVTALSSILICLYVSSLATSLVRTASRHKRAVIACMALLPIVAYHFFCILKWSDQFAFTMKNGATAVSDLRRAVSELEEDGLDVGQIVGPWKVTRAGRFFLPHLRSHFLFLSIDHVTFQPGDLFVQTNQEMPVDTSLSWDLISESRSRREVVNIFRARQK